MSGQERWHLVTECDYIPEYDDPAEKLIWTLSKECGVPGWNTDSGFNGYGLKRADAEFLAAAANEKLDREGRLAPEVKE